MGIPWGIHYHHAQSVIGTTRWAEDLTHVLAAGSEIRKVLGAAPSMLDVGGGWDPGSCPSEIAETIAKALAERPRLLGTETKVVLELGKWLLEESGTLYCRVVGRRGPTDVIVDAGIPDAPETRHWPHRVELLRDSSRLSLGRGDGRILGRTCMETDILAERIDLLAVEVGDVLCLRDVGAYDYSMRYAFGRGAKGQLS